MSLILGYGPLKLWTKEESDHHDLLRNRITDAMLWRKRDGTASEEDLFIVREYRIYCGELYEKENQRDPRLAAIREMRKLKYESS